MLSEVFFVHLMNSQKTRILNKGRGTERVPISCAWGLRCDYCYVSCNTYTIPTSEDVFRKSVMEQGMTETEGGREERKQGGGEREDSEIIQSEPGVQTLV